jgi:hypothetical protein
MTPPYHPQSLVQMEGRRRARGITQCHAILQAIFGIQPHSFLSSDGQVIASLQTAENPNTETKGMKLIAHQSINHKTDHPRNDKQKKNIKPPDE